MEFIDTGLQGCYLIKMDPKGDSRGYFVRTFCANEFAEKGINSYLAQASVSFNAKRGTLRGLHFQASPLLEDKLVRCVRGAIYDVMVDLRPRSPTFGEWVGYELTEENQLELFSPKGFAHGFQTLADDCLVSYQISEFYDGSKSAGVRWNDPAIGVDWPLTPTDLSPRDQELPLLADLDRSQLDVG